MRISCSNFYTQIHVKRFLKAVVLNAFKCEISITSDVHAI